MNKQELQEAIEWLAKDVEYLDKLIAKYEYPLTEWDILMVKGMQVARDHSKRLTHDLHIEFKNEHI